MLENGCAFTAAYPIGNGKSPASAEIGVYRNNWDMLRKHCDHFQGADESEWQSRGQEAHGNVAIATSCQRQLFSKLGENKFFGLQRGGEGNQGAGLEYGSYCYKYLDFIVSGSHLSDNINTFYHVSSM
ncbi:MAG: hypothetical protein Q9226_004126 [Calogaya cf. arnoldii]